MKIELKKSQYFKPEVLDETQTNQELNKNLKEALQRRAGEIFPEVLSEAIRLKKFFEGGCHRNIRKYNHRKPR